MRNHSRTYISYWVSAELGLLLALSLIRYLMLIHMTALRFWSIAILSLIAWNIWLFGLRRISD
jgi:hypothetical protein